VLTGGTPVTPVSKNQTISILEFLLAALIFIVGWNAFKMQQWFLMF
jgi:hypothetical protein